MADEKETPVKTPKTKKEPEVSERLAKVAANAEDAAATETEAPEQGQTLQDLKMGYVVGLTPDGNFVFEVVGKEKGLVELMGLHKYADKRIGLLLDASQGVGDRLLQEVGRLLQQMDMRLDRIAKVVAPNKPANRIE